MVPGLPKFSFIAIASLMFYLVYISKEKDEKTTKQEKEEAEEKERAEVPEDEEVKSLLDMDVMELEIGFGLIPLVDTNQGGTLLNRIKAIRRQVALEMGFIVPPLYV